MKFAWMTAQNYHMMNSKDLEYRPMNHEKVAAFWALNVKYREAFAGTPI
jgi:hypothetical protein